MRYLLLVLVACAAVGAAESYEQQVRDLEFKWTVDYCRLQACDSRFLEKDANGKPGSYSAEFREFLRVNDTALRQHAIKNPNTDLYADARRAFLQQKGEAVPSLLSALPVVMMNTPHFGEVVRDNQLKTEWVDGYWRSESTSTVSVSPRSQQDEIVALRAENARLKEALALVKEVVKATGGR